MRDGSLRLFPDLYRRRYEFAVLKSPIDTLYSVDPVDEINPEPGRRCRVGFFIFPRYDPARRPSIRRITRMEAMRRLVGTKSYISLGMAEKQQAVDFMLSVISKAECFELVTGRLDQTVALIESLRRGEASG